MRRKITCLHICESLDKGGLEEVIYNLVKNTNDVEFDVRVAYFKGGNVSKRLEEKGFTCYEIGEAGKITRIKKLVTLIKEQNVDIVQTHFCLDAMIAAKLAGVKLIETTHNTYHFFVNPWGKRKYSFYLNLADTVVSVSKPVEDFNKQHFNIRTNTKVIRNSIDSERLIQSDKTKEQIKKDFGIPETARVISTLSRIDVQKGLEYFIEVAKLLNQEFDDLLFLIPGTGDEEYTRSLQVLAEGQDNILFIGHIDKVNELFKMMDIYVMSSLWEGAPLTLLEAMAYGKAVVVTDVGNTAEVIDDGKNGFLLEMKDVKGMAEKIGILLKDKVKKETLETNAKSDFEQYFSNEIMISQYRELYRSLVNG